MAVKTRMIATGRCARCDAQVSLERGVGEREDGSCVSVYACALCGTLLNVTRASCGHMILDTGWRPEMVRIVLIPVPRCVHAN